MYLLNGCSVQNLLNEFLIKKLELAKSDDVAKKFVVAF